MAQATAQPSSRSGTGPTGVHTGSTNVIKVERWPAAMISLRTPENVEKIGMVVCSGRT